MTETLTLSPRRMVAPLAAFLVAIALIAMLALGFGIRTWTEHTPHPSAPAGVVTHEAPASAQPVCRIGQPC